MSTVDILSQKIYGRINKVAQRKKGIVNADKLKKEFERKKEELLSLSITEQEICNTLEMWWNEETGK